MPPYLIITKVTRGREQKSPYEPLINVFYVNEVLPSDNDMQELGKLANEPDINIKDARLINLKGLAGDIEAIFLTKPRIERGETFTKGEADAWSRIVNAGISCFRTTPELAEAAAAEKFKEATDKAKKEQEKALEDQAKKAQEEKDRKIREDQEKKDREDLFKPSWARRMHEE